MRFCCFRKLFFPLTYDAKITFYTNFFQFSFAILWNFLIEQVVPNCSPSVINDEKPNIEDELKNSKNGLLPPYKECEDNDRGLLSQIKLEKPPDDEKSNIHSKRRNRRMPENSNTKNFEFFEEDGIFAWFYFSKILNMQERRFLPKMKISTTSRQGVTWNNELISFCFVVTVYKMTPKIPFGNMFDFIRNQSLSTYPIFSEKLIFLTSWYAHVCVSRG